MSGRTSGHNNFDAVVIIEVDLHSANSPIFGNFDFHNLILWQRPRRIIILVVLPCNAYFYTWPPLSRNTYTASFAAPRFW